MLWTDTQEIAEKAWSHIEEVESLGGMTEATKFGVPKLRIEEAATRKQARIDSGQDIIVSFAVKPTSSILNTRDTIDTKGKNTKISVKGRHDPCVVPRAVPIVEAMSALVLADYLLLNRVSKI